jgi:hypothetical protein
VSGGAFCCQAWILKLQVPENGAWSHESFGKTAIPRVTSAKQDCIAERCVSSVSHALPASFSECLVIGVSQ